MGNPGPRIVPQGVPRSDQDVSPQMQALIVAPLSAILQCGAAFC
jgi:hypothetical protein